MNENELSSFSELISTFMSVSVRHNKTSLARLDLVVAFHSLFKPPHTLHGTFEEPGTNYEIICSSHDFVHDGEAMETESGDLPKDRIYYRDGDKIMSH